MLGVACLFDDDMQEKQTEKFGGRADDIDSLKAEDLAA